MIATQSDAVAAVTNEYNWESEFETVSNFIRRERLKIENSGIKLKLWNKLRVPPVVMKIRWIIHVVTAKFFVDRAHHIQLACSDAFPNPKPESVAATAISILRSSKFLMICTILTEIGDCFFIPSFRWVQVRGNSFQLFFFHFGFL